MPRDQKPVNSLIYGPVPSRRLGRSLGVDIVPYKTCTYDCIYCQIGRTPKTTTLRKPYIETSRIIDELKTRLDQGARPDYITVGGSGEPCLNSEIGTIIREIKKISSFPVAVLTNGSLLWDRDVQKALLPADVVLPSMDGHDPAAFAKINRPHPDITFDKMVQGLADFRKIYKGSIWLEIFIVAGINETPEAMEAFKPHLQSIDPDKIHLNTAVRPTAEKMPAQVDLQRLEQLVSMLGPKAEVVAEFSGSKGTGGLKDMEAEIMEMLLRRPCTASDIAAGLGLRVDAVERKMAILVNAGRVEIQDSGGRAYYFRPSDSA